MTTSICPPPSRSPRASPSSTCAPGPHGPSREEELLPYTAEFAARIARRWQTRPPDVVHAHFWTSGFAALGRGVPVVQTFHGLGDATGGHRPDAAGGLPERLRHEARIARDATAIIATCSEEASELAAYGVRPAALHVVPCGVDTGLFHPAAPAARHGDRPRVLTLGRLAPGDGTGTIIEALCHLHDAELIVAGGPTAPSCAGIPRQSG